MKPRIISDEVTYFRDVDAFDKQSTTEASTRRAEHDLDSLDHIETKMRCCSKALVALYRTRTYLSDRSRWCRFHADKRILDHADPIDLRSDVDHASYVNLTRLMCVKEPSGKHPVYISLV